MNNLAQNVLAEEEDLNQFTKNVVPPTARAELRKKKFFLPWHKPRKQWLRTNQWGASISELAADLKLAEAQRPLSYLSLPGQDLLDIRDLSPVCENIGIKIKFLGLNYIDPKDKHAEQMQVEQDLSRNEVLGMNNVDAGSLIINEKFEEVSRETSVTHEKIIKSHQTFDVVNIDLCNSFGNESPADTTENLYAALGNLFTKQAENRTEDWLFFLTTRNNTHMVHKDVWMRFVSIINGKSARDPHFLKSLIAKDVISEAAVADNKIILEQMTRKCHVGVFGLAVGFWITKLLLDQRPAWRVDMLPAYGYHVYLTRDDRFCDMISLGFRVSKVRLKPEDRHDLARVFVGDYVEEAVCQNQSEDRILDRNFKQIDVDVFLYENPAAYEDALNKSKDLLRAARYDIEYHLNKLEEKMDSLEKYLAETGLVKGVG
jgi:hypothetical protein